MMNDFDELFEGWIAGTLSAAEATRFLELAGGPDDPLPAHIDALMQDSGLGGLGNAEQKERLFKQLAEQIGFEQRRPARIVSMPKFKWAVAAAVLLFFGTGIYFLSRDKKKTDEPIVSVKTPDRAPGSKNKAILTINGGQQIILDSQQNGSIVDQSGYQVIKADGKIVYQNGKAQNATISYNTLTVPRGGQYQLQLADGTGVWLNSASSITYPTAFAGTTRQVSITGEVYFEVAKDARRPFSVNIDNRSTVEVLGTHFNINAYPDESNIKTTLLEGKVKVAEGELSLILKPGQQSIATTNSINLNANADLETVMAWKNGLFHMNGASVPDIMRQLARWYDIDIVYQSSAPSMLINGDIPINMQLSRILKVLQENDVHTKLEGRKLIVLP